MVMRKIKLIISYDGTDFHGWQVQPAVRTVAGVVVAALEAVVREPVSLTGASRTDAGVHARGQTADFSTESVIELAGLVRGVNRVLPNDVVVRAAEEVSADFHSSRDALGKHYRYELWLGDTDDPLARRFHWWHRYPLDVEAMKQGAEHLVGDIDFRGLRVKSRNAEQDTVRSISNVAITQSDDMLTIDIFGKSFMYKLVRSMVGLLIAVGRARVEADDIPALLAGEPAARRTEVAPPHGLTLMEVFY